MLVIVEVIKARTCYYYCM